MLSVKKLSEQVSVSSQITGAELERIRALGFEAVINNRPDDEEEGQPESKDLETESKRLGLAYFSLPVVGGNITDQQIKDFDNIVESQKGSILAFCRTGTRCAMLWALVEAKRSSSYTILKKTSDAGYDLSALKPRIDNQRSKALSAAKQDISYQVLIVGGGASGLAVAASLIKRESKLDIAIIEPSEVNYYQPGWTLVGGGIFGADKTARKTQTLLPKPVKWIKSRVATFNPEDNSVTLDDGLSVGYSKLVVAAGLQLDIEKIDGLAQTLGKNGVTTNYQFHLAPYTWQLIRNMNEGEAIFTQPQMPIKCAGAPQKVMYLACDFWRKSKTLNKTNVHFCSAGEGIFGIKEYVPTLMKYIKRYGIDLNFKETLVAIDGPKKTVWFNRENDDGSLHRIHRKFDMIHVTPPQSSPDFIKYSPLANSTGWVDVDPKTLRHVKFRHIYALGDCASTPNAKTMAAARKQAPVLALNLIADLHSRNEHAEYDGYGSCPLTVEYGKIALTEFGYNGKLLPTFPTWLIDGTKPSRIAWWLKVKLMPQVYWRLMLQGREWLAKPKPIKGKTTGR